MAVAAATGRAEVCVVVFDRPLPDTLEEIKKTVCILLVRSVRGYWYGLPNGGIGSEWGRESSVAAGMRETKEESGIDIRLNPDDLIGVRIKEAGGTVDLYRTVALGGVPTTSTETDDVVWVPIPVIETRFVMIKPHHFHRILDAIVYNGVREIVFEPKSESSKIDRSPDDYIIM